MVIFLTGRSVSEAVLGEWPVTGYVKHGRLSQGCRNQSLIPQKYLLTISVLPRLDQHYFFRTSQILDRHLPLRCR